VLEHALGGLGTALVWLAVGAMWFCGLASVTSNSRMLYAFARDFLADIATEAARPGGAQLRVSGGVAFGDVLRVGNDLFGDPVNRSSKLGEDLAEPGELLLAEEVFAKLPSEKTADCVLQPAGTRNAAFVFYLCGAAAR